MKIFYVHYTFILALLLSIVFAAQSEDEYGDEKFREYDDDIDDSYNHSNESVSTITDKTAETNLCNTFISNVTYTYVNGIITIIFAPMDNGFDYWIFLIPSNGGSSALKKLRNVSQSVVYASFGQNDVYKNVNYTAEICPLKPECGKTDNCFKSELFLIRAYKTSSLDCTDWQITARLQPEEREQLITVLFYPTQGYSLCFQEYGIQLNKYNGKTSGKNYTIYEEKNVTFHNKEMVMVMSFNNLSTGIYSANIIAYHEYCPAHGCHGSFITGIMLKEFKSNSSITLPLKKEKKYLPVLVSSSVVLIFIIVTIGVAVKLSKQVNIMNHIPIVKSLQRKVPSNDASKPKGKLKIDILYAQDVPEQQNVTEKINSFLQECCHCESDIAETNAEIWKDSTTWIQNNFNYKYPRDEKTKHNGTKYKLVILETEAAVRIHKASLNHEILAYRNYSHLNNFFICGLKQLTSSKDFLATDHCRLVVIHFSYFPQHNELECFRQKRLYLPQQLVQLYNSLWDRENLLYEEEKLLNEWQNKTSYRELLNAIQEMEQYVTNNPHYLDKYVFGNDEVV